ncbi:MAG: hypothetical protein A7316_03970 [Candidatus Altiarchaeales archaeon WOR_SM1_86-2]|nr:MAG: hypothetical protein A7316_03970 [Candidatus Altiarchaeales archaeon WOR_SM1_86-2]
MEKIKEQPSCEICPPEECDIFDFMANTVGLTVLHPGGLKATEKLSELCNIGKDKIVLDVGCGKGTSAIYLAKEYGCKVIGIDMMEGPIEEGKKNVGGNNLQDRVDLRVGDCHNLPFDDGGFDAVIFQAVLIFMDKSKALREAIRVVKKNGFVGALELTWRKEPTDELKKIAPEIICSAVVNAETTENWENSFLKAGFDKVESNIFHMDIGGPLDTLINEGFINSSRVFFKSLTNSDIRNKTRSIRTFFKENKEYLGYGIYIGKK